MRERPAWELLEIILLATIIPQRDAILISVNNAYHFIIQNTQCLSNDYPIMASTKKYSLIKL